jgi:hypothetical protein
MRRSCRSGKSRKQAEVSIVSPESDEGSSWKHLGLGYWHWRFPDWGFLIASMNFAPEQAVNLCL